MLPALPEPDRPLRDRFALLEGEVPLPELRQWGIALALGEADDVAPEHPSIAWIGGTVGWAPSWARTWGLRLLLHVGVDADASTVAALERSLDDEHWRVREMALKVIARHDPGVDPAMLTARLDDDRERVRAQARRALGLRAP